MKTTKDYIAGLLILLSIFYGVPPAYTQNLTDSLKDVRDGQVYKTIKIGDQWWFAENLNFDTKDSWWYNDDKENGKKYGRLYTWNAAVIACPLGWQLPTDKDWQQLEKQVGLPETELQKKGWRGETINMAAKFDWLSKSNSITSLSFNVLPAGYRKHMQIAFFIHAISFDNMGQKAGFWSSTKIGSNAYYRFFETGKSGIYRYDYFRKAGFCVRCIKNK